MKNLFSNIGKWVIVKETKNLFKSTEYKFTGNYRIVNGGRDNGRKYGWKYLWLETKNELGNIAMVQVKHHTSPWFNDPVGGVQNSWFSQRGIQFAIRYFQMFFKNKPIPKYLPKDNKMFSYVNRDSFNNSPLYKDWSQTKRNGI